MPDVPVHCRTPAGSKSWPIRGLRAAREWGALIPEAFSEGQFDMFALKRAFGGDARVEPGQQDTRGSEAILT